MAPSGIFDPARLQRGLAVLEAWGHRPTLLPGATARWRYLAGDDETRLDDLRRAFAGDWDAIWMARGGYGIGRLLRDLPLAGLRPVPFYGFSDGTALLNPLAEWGLPAVHAPVITSLADHVDDASRAHLRALLAGEPLPALRGTPWIAGDASGELRGGNLCVLASQCGTPWQLDGAGKIVLLEDVGETPYKVDRLLTQLLEAGCLTGAAGFAIGTFVGADAPSDADWTVRDVIVERLGPLGAPILGGLPIGHGPENHAVRFGPARIDGERLWT